MRDQIYNIEINITVYIYAKNNIQSIKNTFYCKVEKAILLNRVNSWFR